MSLRKENRLTAKAVSQQQHVAEELQSLLASIERAERTIVELKAELEEANHTHRDRKTTQEDVDFLTALLKCANKKLGWEKQVASLKKRTPGIMQDITALVQDTGNPPDDVRHPAPSHAAGEGRHGSTGASRPELNRHAAAEGTTRSGGVPRRTGFQPVSEHLWRRHALVQGIERLPAWMNPRPNGLRDRLEALSCWIVPVK